MQLCVTCVQVIHCEPVLARPRKPRGNMVRTVSLAAQDVKPLSVLVKSAIIALTQNPTGDEKQLWTVVGRLEKKRARVEGPAK